MCTAYVNKKYNNHVKMPYVDFIFTPKNIEYVS